MVKFPSLKRSGSNAPDRTAIVQPPLRLVDILAPHDNSFGVIRLILALLVLVSHSSLYLEGSSLKEPLFAETGRSLGQYAVQVFFILSGLMVAKSFDTSPTVRDFAVARVLRIFPALIVCVLLTACLLGPVLSTLHPVTYFQSAELGRYVIKTVALVTGSAPLPGVFDANPLSSKVNTSLWTLKYEVICYVCLAIGGVAWSATTSRLGFCRHRVLNCGAVALAIFVVVVFLNPPAQLEDFTLADNVRYFAVFFATGVLAYVLRDRIAIHGFAAGALLIVFAATRATAIADVVSAISLGYLALWIATKSFGPMRAFANRMDLSYGVYIFAGPIQQAIIATAATLTPLMLAAISIVIVIPIAVLSWVLVERPAMAWRHRLGSTPLSEQSVPSGAIV